MAIGKTILEAKKSVLMSLLRSFLLNFNLQLKLKPFICIALVFKLESDFCRSLPKIEVCNCFWLLLELIINSSIDCVHSHRFCSLVSSIGFLIFLFLCLYVLKHYFARISYQASNRRAKRFELILMLLLFVIFLVFEDWLVDSILVSLRDYVQLFQLVPSNWTITTDAEKNHPMLCFLSMG